MVSAHGTGEVSMLPGMIEMIVRITAAGVVAHPRIVIGMHMRCAGVAGLFVHVGGAVRRFVHRRWAVCRDVSAADAMHGRAAAMRRTARVRFAA